MTLNGPSVILAGDIAYTITVTNNGPSDAQGVVLTDPLPEGMTFVSQAQVAGPAFILTDDGGTIMDTLATLATGGSATFRLVAGVNADVADGAVLGDTAAVGADTTDPDLSNNSATFSTTVGAQAELQVSLAAQVSYTVTVTNTGPDDAQDVSLSDALPAGFVVLSRTQVGGPAFTPGDDGAALADLPAGASAAFAVVADVPADAAQSDAGQGVDSGAPTTWPGYPDPCNCSQYEA